MKIPTGIPATVTKGLIAGDILPPQIMEATQESIQTLQEIAAFIARHRGLILHQCIPHHRAHSAPVTLPLRVHTLPRHIQGVAEVVAVEATDSKKWN